MSFKDDIRIKGIFSIKALNSKDEVIDEYTEKNLIMDTARNNMAQLVGGVTTGAGDLPGLAINKFVIGTRGHVGTDILDAQEVGEEDTSKPSGERIFDPTRTQLFSEAISGEINYHVDFDVTGGIDVTDSSASGQRYLDTTPDGSAETNNVVRREVSGRTTTYTITIISANGNDSTPTDPIAYTEAALYAGGEIFSMKTFPARVKEDTVKFEITWSIIF